jgi:hypothetical protein
MLDLIEMPGYDDERTERGCGSRCGEYLMARSAR